VPQRGLPGVRAGDPGRRAGPPGRGLTAAQPASDDTVVLDGRILERRGRLTRAVVCGAARALERACGAGGVARDEISWMYDATTPSEIILILR
jgi:hypothetical protein